MTQMLEQPQVPARVTRVEQIEGKIDRDAVGKMNVPAGGPQFQNMMEVMEFAKLMAVSDVAVPRHLRGNPGACLAICIQALEWRMWPYAVANKSYVVNDRMSYESQLVHAVVEQRAPLLGRLRCRYTGEGEQRRCIVWARIRGEEEPLEFQSAEFGKIQPKNSPLWKTKPDLQLFYNASRDWARMYFPDVILGVYAEDEIPVVELTGPAATVARAEPLNERVNARLSHNPAPATSPAASASPGSTQPADDATDVQIPPAEQATAGGGGIDPDFENLPAAEPEAPEEAQWPAQLPKDASLEWIDKCVTAWKPQSVTAHAARKVFHAADVQPWDKLGRVRQCEKYEQLLTGSFPWKK